MEAGGYLLVKGDACRIKRASRHSILLENGTKLTPQEAFLYRYSPPDNSNQQARQIGGGRTRQASLI